MDEAQMWPQNAYLTLTYDETNVPTEGLRHQDYQLFLKRLRKQQKHKTIRYYMAGEYGDKNGRPHFHAAIFNHDFTDKKFHKTNHQGDKIYTSEQLQKLWKKGYSSVGELTFQSAAYIARYIMKKQNTNEKTKIKNKYEITQETGEIINRKKEYNQMSRRPGIGQNWLKKYYTDVYPHGKKIIQAHQAPPPRYYDLQYEKLDPAGYKKMKLNRQREGDRRSKHKTPERLHVQHQVKLAQLRKLKRDEHDL